MWRKNDSGATLLITVIAIPVLAASLGSLLVDLPWIDYARSRCQTAADAASLAAAATLARSNCLARAGSITPECSNAAVQNAEALAAANNRDGLLEPLSPSDVTFVSWAAEDPVIKTQVQQHKLPTIFGKMVGISHVGVAATSTAEAFLSPSTGKPAVRLCRGGGN